MPKRHARDSDTSDEEESFEHSQVVPLPIFTPVAPPKLSSIAHDALVKWDKRRKEYEAKMRARCRSTGEDYGLVTQNVKKSFDLRLLETFCSLRLRKDAVDVTECQIIADIQAALKKVQNDDLPDIKVLCKKELKMDLRESDIDARILAYFQRFHEVVLEHGLEDVFTGVEGEKEKCKRVISCLAPPFLKEDVKNSVRWTNKEAAKSMRELYTLVYEEALEHERHFQQNKRMRLMKDKTSSSSSAKSAGKSVASSKKPARGDFKDKKKFSPQKHEKRSEAKAEGKANKKPFSKKEPPSPCPKCQEMHWFNDCTKATDSEKVVLCAKLREANKTRKSRVKRLKRYLPHETRTVTLNGVLELPCCPDTGADHTVICRQHWELLRQADPTVQQVSLDQPVQFETFGSHLVVFEMKTLLFVMIHTAAGPVQPAEAVPVLIVENDDDELIIGRDLLGRLGIDVDRQLEQLASHQEDATSGDPFGIEADESPVNSRPSATDEEVRAAVETLVDKALAHGFPADKVEKLRLIVHMYDVWRIELRDDPPVRVPPLEGCLKEGAAPCKCKPRKYPPHVRQFLREFNEQLVALRWVYENPTSRWASPVLPVKKSQELMDLRQATDYREFNSMTDIMAAVMPIISLVMENARGMKHFGLFDFIKGIWQLPLAEFCKEWLSYMTDEKIFTPRRVPQACGDAAIHSQKTMATCFATLLYKHLLVWIDDLLLYADDIGVYLDKLAEMFSLLKEFGLKLSVKKSSLYQTEVKWCGRIIDAQGVRHDPARIESLRAVPYPNTAGELQQFLCAVNWMRESLVDYARQISPLQHRLDSALAKTRRTKRVAAGISLELTAEEKVAFDNVKDMLAASVTLDFPDDEATTCLLTDASDLGWAVIVTQVKNYDANVPERHFYRQSTQLDSHRKGGISHCLCLRQARLLVAPTARISHVLRPQKLDSRVRT